MTLMRENYKLLVLLRGWSLGIALRYAIIVMSSLYLSDFRRHMWHAAQLTASLPCS